jgi:two-component system nitrogen regulation response regulator GlnG
MTTAIWIIDDDQAIRWVLEKALAREQLSCRSFDSADAALAALAEGDGPCLLLSDIRMPGASGLDLLRLVKSDHPQVPVIIMTAYSDLDSAVAAFQGGAFEYLPKPFDVDQAVALVKRALATLIAGSDQVSPPLPPMVPEILGQAPAMQEVFRAIGRLSASMATVLIQGETGSGKELVAHALHRHSPRARSPFVAINTAAIPRDLLESELFGHERGAFTGASTQRPGRFEQALGGTLFLDEIGDMPAELQTRLLRVLSDGHYYRVGGQQLQRADVRIIAATHQDIEARVREGLFREDLFHRLNVIRLRIPSLRERPEDIPLLTRHFLAKSARDLGVECKRMTPAAMDVFSAFAFPGNVRQLENLCHWLTVMAPGMSVEPADLPAECFVSVPTKVQSLNVNSAGQSRDSWASVDGATEPSGEDTAGRWLSGLANTTDRLLTQRPGEVHALLLGEFERTLIERALMSSGGRRMEAAQLLGIGRNTITRKIQELGMVIQ